MITREVYETILATMILLTNIFIGIGIWVILFKVNQAFRKDIFDLRLRMEIIKDMKKYKLTLQEVMYCWQCGLTALLEIRQIKKHA